MIRLTVIETGGETLSRRIGGLIARRGSTSIITVPHAAPDIDILVVSPYCDVTIPDCAGLRCRFLLLPGGVRAGFTDAQCVVTYGMGVKNTLTLSSIGEDNCILALQREVVTVSGGVLDRQEFKVRAAGGAEDVLAINGALLLLGLPPY